MTIFLKPNNGPITMAFSRSTNVSQLLGFKNINMMLYLRHQWPDEAHTLQSCSSDQYSETVEYEAPTPSGYEVMATKLPISGRNYCLLPALRSEFFLEFALTSQLPAN